MQCVLDSAVRDNARSDQTGSEHVPSGHAQERRQWVVGRALCRVSSEGIGGGGGDDDVNDPGGHGATGYGTGSRDEHRFGAFSECAGVQISGALGAAIGGIGNLVVMESGSGALADMQRENNEDDLEN